MSDLRKFLEQPVTIPRHRFYALWFVVIASAVTGFARLIEAATR